MRTLIYVVFLLFSLSVTQLQASSFLLKRVIITWNDGTVDDSAASDSFSANGSMNISGGGFSQDITFCVYGSCEKIVENASATVLYIHPNYAYITAKRNEDGSIDDLILQSVSPNIITLYVYEDGTAEAHEWEPTAKAAKIVNDNNGVTFGSVAKGVAEAIKSTKR